MRGPTAAGLGAAAALGGRALVARLLLAKFRGHVRDLNAGDYRSMLANYAPDAVLLFNEGDHRWAGEHRGKAAIERFLQDFVAAGVKGEITEVAMAGPPWRLTLFARFDDGAAGPDGEEIYRNRVAMVLRTRWGRIVEHEDFYEDTGRIELFEARLRDLGVAPAGR